jgi:hypothetical protein
MLRQVLEAMPAEAATGLWLVASAGALIGGVLWLAGSRFSRLLVTLLCVAMGAVIGLKLPRWMEWSIAGWASAMCGGAVLGVLGYWMHRMWVGVGLALLAGVWAAYAVLAAYPGQAVMIPVEPVSSGLIDYLGQVARDVSPELHKALPFAAGIAAVAAIAIAVLLPRTALYLFYSLLGVTLLSLLGTTAMLLLRPQMLAILPSRGSGQTATILGMVLFGAIVQWRMAPRPAGPSVAVPPDDD